MEVTINGDVPVHRLTAGVEPAAGILVTVTPHIGRPLEVGDQVSLSVRESTYSQDGYIIACSVEHRALIYGTDHVILQLFPDDLIHYHRWMAHYHRYLVYELQSARSRSVEAQP